jgi:hypothetical protein
MNRDVKAPNIFLSPMPPSNSPRTSPAIFGGWGRRRNDDDHREGRGGNNDATKDDDDDDDEDDGHLDTPYVHHRCSHRTGGILRRASKAEGGRRASNDKGDATTSIGGRRVTFLGDGAVKVAPTEYDIPTTKWTMRGARMHGMRMTSAMIASGEGGERWGVGAEH